MRRKELEARLRALGWYPAGLSGARHVRWKHARKTYVVVVPIYDLLNDSNAAGILARAEE